MKNKVFVVAALVVIGSWLAFQLTQNRTRYRIAGNRHKQISLIIEEVEKLREPILNIADETISRNDLHKAIDIFRLEGQIRDLRMENAVDLSQSNKNTTYPDFLPILILVFISVQIAMLDKKLTNKEEPPV